MDMNTLTARMPHPGAQHTTTRWGWLLGLALTALCAPTWASNTEIAGVHYEPQTKVEGNTLVLNGSGISYKALQKVYTVGLYTDKKSSSGDAILAMPGSKQLRFVMLVPMRVDELGKLIARGIETNSSRDQFMRLIPATIEMGRIFSKMKRMSPGDTITIEYVPRRGTIFFVNGSPAGMPVAGPEFFNAVLKVWIGPKPTTQDLKEALLDFKPAPLLNALED
ncbi:MAG TPA: chalcone isomerase family protein [Aquabacterium sp.]|nr:chalcone isomerase family protein [Aquabacterium sp.]